MKQKILLRLLSVLLMLFFTVSQISSVYATDDLDSLEQSSTELENELSALETELENLSAEITSISRQINETTEEIKQTKSELAIAKGQEEVQYEAMKQRIQFMYENGSGSFWEMLFSSASLADFLNRAEFFSTINEYDQTQLQKFAETKESIAEKEAQLLEKQETLYSLQEELSQKEQTITSKISDASFELSSITKQIEDAKEAAQNAQDELDEEVEPVYPSNPEPPSVPSEPDVSDEPDVSEGPDTSEDNTPSEPETPDYAASASDLELFAALIECEAGSTDYEGMLAVASVVVNRMNHSHYPDTLRGVIYQAGQFPPAHDGKVDKVLARGVKDSCLQVANDALAGKNNVGDCLSFRSASSGHVGIIIGDNVFF